MQFLSDVYLRCPDCDGKRYRAEVLESRCGNKVHGRRPRHDGVAGAELLLNNDDVVRRLKPLVDVGLDYLRLGQPVPTLSGGEAQRLKLAGYLASIGSDDSNKLFLFERAGRPACTSTTWRSCCAPSGSCSLRGIRWSVIEHNLDVIRSSDWILDLGRRRRGGR